MYSIKEYNNSELDPEDLLRLVEQQLEPSGDFERDGLVIRKKEGIMPTGKIVAGLASYSEEGFGTRFAYNPAEISYDFLSKIEGNVEPSFGETPKQDYEAV